MKIDTYRSAKNSQKYLSVPAGVDVSKFAFPADLDPDLHQLCPFKSQQELIIGQTHAALDVEDMVKQIGLKGYAAHFAKFVIETLVSK